MSSPCSPAGPPLFRLPPEILLRVLHFVALAGSPPDIARCHQVCRQLHHLVRDDSKATDRSIWRSSASSFFQDLLPPELPTPHTWRDFVKLAWQLHMPGFDVLDPDAELYTSSSGPFPPPSPKSIRIGSKPALMERTQPALSFLPPVSDGATRVLDVVHSSTEASRVIAGVPAMCTKHDHVVFSDDPDYFVENSSPSEIFRARFTPDIDAIEVLHDTTVPGTRQVERESSRSGMMAWIKSTIHSDADLELKVHVPEKGAMFEVTRVRRLSDGREWDLSNSGGWDGLNQDPQKYSEFHAILQQLHGPLLTWEFRSAGDYLVVCDDCNGFAESTVSVFASTTSAEYISQARDSGKVLGPLWQRRMVSTHGTTGPGFFYDNDGIAITSAYVVYASRSKKPIPNGTPQIPRPPPRGTTVCAEFIIMSTATGEVMRICALPNEERLSNANLCYWTSFSVSSTHLIATVGGQHGDRHDHMSPTPRYGYPHIFLWSLTSFPDEDDDLPPDPQSPSMQIPLPCRWNPSVDVYTAVSPCGRWLAATAGWELALWDVTRKTEVGRWLVPDAHRWHTERPENMRAHANFGWNGTWVIVRDVFPDNDSDDGDAYATTKVIYLAASQWRAAYRAAEPGKGVLIKPPQPRTAEEMHWGNEEEPWDEEDLAGDDGLYTPEADSDTEFEYQTGFNLPEGYDFAEDQEEDVEDGETPELYYVVPSGNASAILEALAAGESDPEGFVEEAWGAEDQEGSPQPMEQEWEDVEE